MLLRSSNPEKTSPHYVLLPLFSMDEHPLSLMSGAPFVLGLDFPEMLWGGIPLVAQSGTAIGAPAPLISWIWAGSSLSRLLVGFAGRDVGRILKILCGWHGGLDCWALVGQEGWLGLVALEGRAGMESWRRRGSAMGGWD